MLIENNPEFHGTAEEVIELLIMLALKKY